ncbi:hypothetical protein SDC9_151325 [bioreactor metagenome]|uniref:Uncharacterized protein n=1 Tax=bioreactor metagenome TaxID=1076179 RepID=A0A645ESC6_9ZZZZ
MPVGIGNRPGAVAMHHAADHWQKRIEHAVEHHFAGGLRVGFANAFSSQLGHDKAFAFARAVRKRAAAGFHDHLPRLHVPRREVAAAAGLDAARIGTLCRHVEERVEFAAFFRLFHTCFSFHSVLSVLKLTTLPKQPYYMFAFYFLLRMS